MLLSQSSTQIITAWNEAQFCVLPVILSKQVNPTLALALVIQHAHSHLTGSEEMGENEMRLAVKALLVSWAAGEFKPAPDYPYTLQQTLNFAKSRDHPP